MSHFTEVKTQIKDLRVLKKVLQDLNIRFKSSEQGIEVVNFFGDKELCVLSIETGTKYSIGVKQTQDGSFELVADWELLKQCKVDTEKLRKQILQRYAYRTVKEKLEAQNYTFGEETVDEQGNLQMVVTQW